MNDHVFPVRVLFFATLRDKAGVKAVELDVSAGTTVGELKARLASEYPVLSEAMETVVLAVNREFAFDDSVIPVRAEVALFPPVSGG